MARRGRSLGTIVLQNSRNGSTGSPAFGADERREGRRPPRNGPGSPDRSLRDRCSTSSLRTAPQKPGSERVLRATYRHAPRRCSTVVIDLAPEPLPEQVIDPSMPHVVCRRVRRVRARTSPREIPLLGDLHDKVVVVAHQAIGVEDPAVATRNAIQNAKEELPVAIVLVDRTPVVAARRDVVIAVRNLDAPGRTPSSPASANDGGFTLLRAAFRRTRVRCLVRWLPPDMSRITAWPRPRAADARRRLPRARADRRPPAPHADAHVARRCSDRVGVPGPLQGGAAPAHGLVQAARRAEQARDAQRRGEGARRDLDLRRQPRAGARVRVRGRRDRRARRDVADGVADEDRRRPRVRRRPSTTRRPTSLRRSSTSTAWSRRPAERSCIRTTTRS